jgi:integrase
LMILLCGRPSDISGLQRNQVIIGKTHITVNRVGTKADRRFRGSSVLIPITPSVLVPRSLVGLSIALLSVSLLMSRALKLAFPKESLSPGIIRKSSASMYRQRNLSNRDIMEVGGWSSEDTLRRFYSRANTNWISSFSMSDLTPFSSREWPEMVLAP